MIVNLSRGDKMKKPLILNLFLTGFFLALLFIPYQAFSTDHARVKSDLSDLRVEKKNGYDQVTLEDAHSFAPPGAPDLPVKIFRVYVPQDLELGDVILTYKEKTVLAEEYWISPVQPEVPLSQLEAGKIETIPPDPAIYGSATEFPGKLLELGSGGFMMGQKIAEIFVYPLQYIPSEKKLILITDMELEFVYEKSQKKPLPTYNLTEKAAKFRSDMVKNIVINPQEVEVSPKGFSAQDTLIEYLIITPNSFIPAFQPLVEWKSQKGILIDIKTTEWIYSNFTGDDDQEKIRNFIRHAFQNYGTLWVLLGGDIQYVPHRLAWAFIYDGDWRDDIPADLYYSDLDGDWNWDGDDRFGEYCDSVDLYPDVLVGRVPANTENHIQAFVNKVLTYEKNPPDDYTTKVLMAGGILWDSPYTDGGVLKNVIQNIYLPEYFDVTKLYESENTLNKTSFRNNFNSGMNIINHYHHGSVSGFDVGTGYWYKQDMDDLTNSSKPSVLYTISCLSNAFDMDCLGEHSIRNPDGGCVAYIGNSRYGWGSPGSPTQGSGPQMDMKFFSYLFTQNSYHAGKTLADAKSYYVPQARVQSSGNYLRCAIYALNLMGDPELCIWNDSLAELIVSHPKKLQPGAHQINVEVSNAGEPLSGALACLSNDPEIYFRDTTDSVGEVGFSLDVMDTCQVLLVVTSHNYVPYQYPIEFVDYQPGDANGDGSLNVSDCIFLANYLLKQGQAPDPLDLGEADCNGSINLSDVIIIANYYFKGGPTPCSF